MKKKSHHNNLDYTGSYETKKGYYEFKMKDTDIIKFLNYLKAYNPSFGDLFKKVFRNEYIPLSFLNDFLSPKENKIKNTNLKSKL